MSSLSNSLIHSFTTQQDQVVAIVREVLSFEFDERWGQFNSAILDGVMQLDKQQHEFTNWCLDIRSRLSTYGMLCAPRFNAKNLSAKIVHIADDLMF